jgi:arginyl-tRNA synthetase
MIKEKIRELIEKNIAEKIDFDIEIPRDLKFGDYSTNIALILAKKINKNPQEIAEDLINEIGETEYFEKIEHKSGFINFYLSENYLQKQVEEIINQKEKFGENQDGKNKKIQIEFISANPTGPLTIGNSRGGIIGDVLVNVFIASDWKTEREYYFNDAGGQIDILGHSVLKDDKAEYVGDYIDKLHNEIKTKDYKEAGKLAAQKLIEDIKKTTTKMGIKFDNWFTEGKDLREKGKVEEIIKWLKEKKLSYEKDDAVWFKSTEFGDDKDRVLIKKDGSPTYFGVDCAYHKNKFVERKFDQAIDIWGPDHHGDISRVKGFVKALGYEKNFEIIMHQLVRVIQDGKEVRMSKRKGNYILVDDLIRSVGKDVFRFFMLEYSPNSHLTFDLNLAKERSEKNPVFYVQYAYARICNILKKAKNLNPKLENLNLLKEPVELDLIKQLIKYPDLIKETTRDYQVQKFATYSKELANAFHNFYEKCQVISEDKKIEEARIALLQATKIVLKNVLNLMGISAPKKM